LNAYLICLRFTGGSTIKRTFQVGRSVLGRFQSRGVSPRAVQLGGVSPDGKIPLPYMTKGEIFIRYRTQRHGSKGSDAHKGSMSDMTSISYDMTSILHQSVSINSKGGYC
jgi:hypothetical protein